MPKHRIIDLREGDSIWHEGSKRFYLVKGIEAYRDNRMEGKQLQADLPSEGYLVRGD